MKSIPIICLSLLLASVFALQLTSPQNNVFFVPATEGAIKVRPANLTGAVPQVVDLQEADRRHKEIYKTDLTDPNAYDGSDCLLGSCGLEIELTIAKHYLLRFIKG